MSEFERKAAQLSNNAAYAHQLSGDELEKRLHVIAVNAVRAARKAYGVDDAPWTDDDGARQIWIMDLLHLGGGSLMPMPESYDRVASDEMVADKQAPIDKEIYKLGNAIQEIHERRMAEAAESSSTAPDKF